MENKTPLILPFSRRRHQLESSDTVHRARVQQGAIHNQFVVHRNAGRVQKYFIRLRSHIGQCAVLLIAMVLTGMTIPLTIIFSSQAFRRSYSVLIDMTLASIEATALDTCQHLMSEALFTSSLEASMYTPPSWVTIDLEGATDITSMMNFLHQWTSGRIFYWDLGLTDGTMFSIESFVAESRKVTLVYVNSSGPTEGGPFLAWETDQNGKNPDYPYTGGTVESIYVLTGRDWYQTALSLNASTYMDPYFGSGVGNDTFPMISAVCPVWNNENDTFTGVCACGVMLIDIQNMLMSLATERSRYGLVDSYGYLVAVTGDDPAYEDFQGVLSAKTLYELKDPVWIAIVDDPKFENVQSGYRETYVIEGKKLTYSVRVATVAITDKIKWTFYFAMCEDDSFPDSETGVNELLVPIVLLVIAWVIIFSVEYGGKTFMKKVENKFLTPRKFKADVRIYPPGLVTAIKDLERVGSVETRAARLKRDVSEARDILTGLNLVNMFHGDGFLSAIPSKTIRDKVRTQYNSHSYLPMEVRDVWIDVGMKKTLGTLKHRRFVVYARTGLLELPPGELKRCIVHRVLYFNHSSNAVFKNRELIRVLGDILLDIGPQEYPLIADSLDLLAVLLQKERFVRRRNRYESMATVLAILIFHRAMKDRQTKKELFDRYFCEQPFLLQKINRDVLMRLRPGFTSDDEANWEQLTGLVRCFLDVCSLREAQWVLSGTAQQLKSSSTTEKVMSKEASWGVALVVFVSSMFSYVVGTPSLLRQSNAVINPDFEQRRSEIEVFIGCFMHEFTTSLIKCLVQTHGKELLNTITQPSDQNINIRDRAVSSVFEQFSEVDLLLRTPPVFANVDSDSSTSSAVNENGEMDRSHSAFLLEGSLLQPQETEENELPPTPPEAKPTEIPSPPETEVIPKPEPIELPTKLEDQPNESPTKPQEEQTTKEGTESPTNSEPTQSESQSETETGTATSSTESGTSQSVSEDESSEASSEDEGQSSEADASESSESQTESTTNESTSN